jgi:hypothetical protein
MRVLRPLHPPSVAVALGLNQKDIDTLLNHFQLGITVKDPNIKFELFFSNLKSAAGFESGTDRYQIPLSLEHIELLKEGTFLTMYHIIDGVVTLFTVFYAETNEQFDERLSVGWDTRKSKIMDWSDIH